MLTECLKFEGKIYFLHWVLKSLHSKQSLHRVQSSHFLFALEVFLHWYKVLRSQEILSSLSFFQHSDSQHGMYTSNMQIHETSKDVYVVSLSLAQSKKWINSWKSHQKVVLDMSFFFLNFLLSDQFELH